MFSIRTRIPRPWIVGCALLLLASTVFGLVSKDNSNAPQQHFRSMDGLTTGARTLNLKALRKSLPKNFQSSPQILIITDCCLCPHCTPFFTKTNDTKLPGLLVTDAVPPADRSVSNTTDRSVSNLAILSTYSNLLTDEMLAADGAGLLVDFDHNTVVVARGPFDSWSEALKILNNNASAYKVKL